MYNNRYKAKKNIIVFTGNGERRTIPRGSILRICWCGGKHSSKEFKVKMPWVHGKIKAVTVILPDETVERHLSKI